MTDVTDDPLALERQVCFALAVASRNVIALYRPVLEPMGLTHPQYLVMLALWERSPRTLRDLCEAVALDPGTLSPLLKRLEANGLITRERDRDDERALAVTLTTKGRRLRPQALKVPGKIVAKLGLPISELERMHAVLTTVIAASGAQRETTTAASPAASSARRRKASSDALPAGAK